MFRSLFRPFSFLRQWRAARHERQLFELLSHAEWDAPLAVRNQWLIDVVRWLRRTSVPKNPTGATGHGEVGGAETMAERAEREEITDTSATDTSDDTVRSWPQHVRLRFLLRTLAQHPDWRRNVSRLLRATLAEGDAISMLCDTGMPTRSGFWGALTERIGASWIPPAPNTRDLSALVILMFGDDQPDRQARRMRKAAAPRFSRTWGWRGRWGRRDDPTPSRLDDAAWIDALPAELLQGLFALLHDPDADEVARVAYADALLAAMHNLCYQIGSTGLSPAVRSRLSEVRIRALPFYQLGPVMQAVEAADAHTRDKEPLAPSASGEASTVTDRGVEGDANANASSRANGMDDTRAATIHLAAAQHIAAATDARRSAQSTLLQEVNVLRALLDDCHAAITELYAHLDANGVSVEVVYQVERMRARLVRLERLLDAWLAENPLAAQASLFADLVRAVRARQSVGHLIRVNFALLARKMIESCAQTGDHYIARDRAEYRKMLWMASGGGALTMFTVYIKFFVTGAHWAPMVEGTLAGLNYAISFVLMHFLHFTLATKQPAMTAPAIAARLEDTGTPEGMDAFATDVIALMRTQAAAVFGNLALVFPLCLLAQLGWAHLTHGGHLISPAKAEATLRSFSLLGPTPIYAAMTGVLLWLSGLIAGWAENWFALHRLADVLYYNRRLRTLTGERGAAHIAGFWRRNFSGIVSNLSLGMMLGIVPAVMGAFALPFEVRHVTLSTGSIAAAIGVLGPKVLHDAALWWAVAGTAIMAVLNVAVSFFLAFQMALRSRTSLPVDKVEIYRAIRRRLVRHPWSLLFPPAT
ncbi:site-specific recombinase [Robbsia andropogonis]|uniref:site-specific recombinase n=1 Tax=Robbsia andropogonis TaxID=28092 RepID=UPI003D233B1C